MDAPATDLRFTRTLCGNTMWLTAGRRVSFSLGSLRIFGHIPETSLGLQGQVTGVELREDMVRLGNTAAARLEQPGLRHAHGDEAQRLFLHQRLQILGQRRI